jgi:predicted ribosome quality control (RQC) complex YloA/Tae2 family protein
MKLTLNHTLALISLVLSLASPAVAAWGFCSQPSAPFCATRYGPFDDTYDFDHCRREMQSYKSGVEDFLSCQRNEMENIRNDNERAVQEYNDAVESFNRRARG